MADEKRDELKACPFCGAVPKIVSGYDDTWLIRHACKPHDAHGVNVHIQANWKSEVSDAWNTREPAIGAEALEKVRELASQIATMRVQTGGGEDVDSRAENSHRKFLGEKILALLAPHGEG